MRQYGYIINSISGMREKITNAMNVLESRACDVCHALLLKWLAL